MKVMCVQQFRSANGLAIPAGIPFPEVFDECVVTGQYVFGDNMYYKLEGYPEVCGYNATCFAILPSESDEVAVEHEQEAIIYQR